MKEENKTSREIMPKEKDVYYIVGKVINFETKSWEFSGLFDTELKAVQVCVSEKYFIARVPLNEFLGDETSEYDYAYYPLLNAKS